MPLACIPPEPGRQPAGENVGSLTRGNCPRHCPPSCSPSTDLQIRQLVTLLSPPGGAAHKEGDRGHPGEEGGGASRVAHSPGVMGVSPSLLHYLEG